MPPSETEATNTPTTPAAEKTAERKAEPQTSSAEPKPDPMMAQLVQTQRELETVKKELDAHRTKVKQFERDGRKQAVLSGLYTEFPALAAHDVRGATLVAADDGVIDLYGEDPKVAVEKMKEILAAKSKKTPAPTPAAANVGGTPGTPGKPPTTKQTLPI